MAVADPAGVLVMVERRGGRPAPTAFELLAAAHRLRATVPGPVCALLMGQDAAQLAGDLIARGADRVLLVPAGALDEYEPEAYAAAVQAAVAACRPALVLFAQSLLGRDLAPRVAFQLGAALAPDCVDLQPGPRGLAMLRPVYGGKYLEVLEARGAGPVLATLRAKTFTPLEPDAGRDGQVVTLDVAPQALRARVVGRQRREAAGVRLEDADVIIAGGRGLGGPEGFAELGRVAAMYGGAVGASRAAVDAGWVDSSLQVGLTGKMVKPRLYVAVGISGATQHQAGCGGARTIVAINNDANAPIFRWAHYGIVADWRKAVPALTRRMAELLG